MKKISKELSKKIIEEVSEKLKKRMKYPIIILTSITQENDENFNDKIRLRIPYLRENQTRLVISTNAQANLTSLEDMLNNSSTGWIAIWELYKDPSTKTTIIVDRKNSLRERIEGKMHQVYIDIPKTALTEQDKEILGIHKPDESTPINVVNYSPVLSVNDTKHLLIQLRISDPENPHTQAMPKGNHVHINVGFKDNTTGNIIWDVERFYEVYKYLFNVEFKKEDVNKCAYFRARYVSPKGNPGRWCDDFSSGII